ncbi:MAG: lysozyme inhibitor LprI family protein [Pseudobdellovibrionaceae bacterium]
MKNIFQLSLTCLFISGSSFADTPYHCPDKPYSAFQEAICHSNIESLDKEYENYQHKILSILETREQKEAFDAFQISWKEYIERKCEYVSSGFSGSQKSSLKVDCLAKETKIQLNFLEDEFDTLPSKIVQPLDIKD